MSSFPDEQSSIDRSRPRLSWPTATAVAIAGLGIAALSVFLDLGELLRVVGRADPGWLALGLAGHCGTIVASALRLRILVPAAESPRPGLGTATAVEAVSTAVVYALPAGIGEIARAALWRGFLGVRLARMAIAIVVVRALDVFWVSIAVVLVVAAGWLPPHPVTSGVLGVFVVLGGLAALFLSAVAWRGSRLLRWLPAAIRACVSSGPPDGRRVITLTLLATLYWFASFLTMAGLARAILPAITWREVAAIFAFGFAIYLSPARGVADVGTHELAWVVPLTLLGHDRESALVYAAATHLLLVAVIVAPMAPAAVLLGIARRAHTSVSAVPPIRS